MQYHLNGFRPGDPAVAHASENDSTDPSTVDVLIIGCGPAGLTLAAQLSQFADISVRVAERKSGPLEIGQADGLACRSLEMFEAFGFSQKVLREGYQVNEVTFWRPNEDTSRLRRADRIQDVEDDLSEMPHVILNQARVHDFYLEMMSNAPQRIRPDYNRELIALDRTDDAGFPVQATLNCLDSKSGESNGHTETIHARYIVGCDGARSQVRRALGLELKGEAARQLWGVMDVLAVTDFPDIRLKSAIQSADQGSILIIPREGGYLVRLYIELDKLTGDERAADRNVSAEQLIDKANRILSPFTLDVKEVAWWSAYEIGQRVCDRFDDLPDDARNERVPCMFIAGDACHTHSPKAGQGMNVSMADSFNLGWKLASVLRGHSTPALLHTYNEERQAKAKELIDFDRDMAHLFSNKPRNPVEAEKFQYYFQMHGRFTAGVETRYSPSIITTRDSRQSLATGLTVGMRFHSGPVIRLADGLPMHLGHALKADGRWRLVVFAPVGDIGQNGGRIDQICRYLGDNAHSPILRYTPKGADIDSVIELLVVFQSAHQMIALESLPRLLLPSKGRYRLTDYEKIFCSDPNKPHNIFEQRGIDRDHGALLIVRPDQFIASVLPIDAFDACADFFAQFMLDAND